jgi:hypothetical protein
MFAAWLASPWRRLLPRPSRAKPPGVVEMSVEMHVFFRGKLPDKKTLSRMMAELGFPFTIAAGSLERQSGFMPMRLRREQTGVEFDVYNARAAVEELGGKDLDPAFERSANFRWAGDEDEMLAGMCATAALAKLVNGLVLDDGDGRLLSPDEAVAVARETLKSTLKSDDTQRRSYRTDIKHYLKPLLKERSDLVFVRGMLLIRPVRHVLRGVGFGKIHAHTSFDLWQFVCPLFSGDEHSTRIASLRIWEPHFEPLLMDVLATEIFEEVSKFASIDDYAARLPNTLLKPTNPISRAWAMLLSGQRERAVAHVDDFERQRPNTPQWKPLCQELREFAARDVDDLCAHLHAKEAAMVKAMKLERIWEPSPFPIELPAAERKNRSDEPAFATVPWIARPPWLIGQLPERPGEVCFFKDWRLRERTPVLVAPLGRDQAEERHRNCEGYVLAARLADGLLVLLDWDGTDRNHPYRIERPNFTPYVGHIILRLIGSQFMAQVYVGLSNDFEERRRLNSVGVIKRQTGASVWNWAFYPREDRPYVSLPRSRATPSEPRRPTMREAREVIYEYGNVAHEREVTSGEIEQLMFKPPSFGEFEELVQKVLNLLRSKGYGDIT